MIKILLLCTLAAYPDWLVPNGWKVEKIDAVSCECPEPSGGLIWHIYPAADPCERTIVHLSKEAEIGEQIKLPPGCLDSVQSVQGDNEGK